METSRLASWLYLSLTLTLVYVGSQAQDKNKVPIEETITSHTFRPRRVDATPERIKLLHAPPGFSISVFASGTGNPRMMKVMRDGSVYVTDRNNGSCC
jgi:glucose/arabinose dehydrogenase